LSAEGPDVCHLSEDTVRLGEVVFEQVQVASIELATSASAHEQEEPDFRRPLASPRLEGLLGAVLLVAFHHHFLSTSQSPPSPIRCLTDVLIIKPGLSRYEFTGV
jgi:hypothetical protein